MRLFLLTWACTAAVMLPLDALWLRLMGPFYQAQLGDLLLPSPRMGAAAVFYLIYAAGAAILIVMPSVANPSWIDVAWKGAILGLVAYGTYDVTNYATLRGFPLTVVAVDWTWGVVVTAVSVTGGWFLARTFGAG